MNQVKQSLESGLQELRTLRDEIRLKLHLAGKEAREQWETHLEPHVERIEQQLRSAGDNAREAVTDAIDRARTAFEEYRDRLLGRARDEAKPLT
jgi:ElaB/YqjD/DUF883 family membrane-anchored ribosome-binding protein